MAEKSNLVTLATANEAKAVKVDPADRLRIRAAWIYYVEGCTQNEVAERLGTSRVAVTRLLAEARRRGEVSIRINSTLVSIIELECRLEEKFGLTKAIVAPFCDKNGDPTKVIAAAAGAYISEAMADNMTIGVGWGRTLHAALPFIEGRSLKNVRVVSLLGGIAQAKRFNPAEFAWQFAELFDAEGFLIPAPALVDSPETKHALLEHCGLDLILQMAGASDLAIMSAGGISTLTTSYRLGHVSESERQSLEQMGAVGDILYNFVDRGGEILDHPVNERAVSIKLDDLARIPKRVLVSGGTEKINIMKAALKRIRPTSLITDEQTARSMLEDNGL